MDYTYRCVKCGDNFITHASPKDYRIATGKFVSCCGEAMQLVKGK